MKSFLLHIICIFPILFTGCISDYYADIESTTNLLVVEGTITQGITKIKLSKSVGLNDFVINPKLIDNAKVSVECDDGTLYPADAHVEKGTYTIRIEELNQQARYRLLISLEGKEYESSFLEPMETPPIESVSFLKETRGVPIHIVTSTQNDATKSPYYKWSYEEIWEIEASMYATIAYDSNGDFIYYNLATGPNNPNYYCWKYGKQRSLLIGAYDRLAENSTMQKELIKISPSSDRFSKLYYIKVGQNSIRKEAYDYFMNIKSNVENSGDVFAPIPLELRGNVRCVTDSDIPVVGYVEVSNTAWKEVWVPEPNNLYEEAHTGCHSLPVLNNGPPPEVSLDGYDLLVPIYNPLTHIRIGLEYAPKDCIDCRRKGGTKNKPDFWPNDHK